MSGNREARKHDGAGAPQSGGREDGYLILVINPGSTSTKIAVYRDETPLFEETLRHSASTLEKYPKVWDQYSFRKREILAVMEKHGISVEQLSAVVARGGLLKPIVSGTYVIDQKMVEDLRKGIQGHHAANLGGVLAYGIAWERELPAYIVDPPCVDELEPLARISGMAGIERTSLLHALNMKATGRKLARDKGKALEDLNIVMAHLGGGITVCAMRKGRMINVNNGIEEGPFSPERAGSVPTLKLLELCFSGKYTKEQIRKKLVGRGGLCGYLGTNNALEVENRAVAGDKFAAFLFEAMAYQVAEEIAARAADLKGEVDYVCLTGSLARSDMFCEWVEERVSFIAPVVRYPGENELEALALGCLRVLRGEETPLTYDVHKKMVGVVFLHHLEEYDVFFDSMERWLKNAGYRFRQADENLELLYKNCQGDYRNMEHALEELTEKKVDVLVAVGSGCVPTLKQYRERLGEIPALAACIYDPVLMDLGDGIHAVSYRVPLLDQLRQYALKLFPDARDVWFLYKAGELHSEIQLDEMQEAARRLDLELHVYDVQRPTDLSRFVERLEKSGDDPDFVFLSSCTPLAEATRAELEPLCMKWPCFSTMEPLVKKGALGACCLRWRNVCEDAAAALIALLNGSDPGRSKRRRKVEKILNIRTAEALGLQSRLEEWRRIADTVVEQ